MDTAVYFSGYFFSACSLRSIHNSRFFLIFQTQVRMSMQKVLSCLAPSTLVDVIVIDIPPEGTRQLAALIDRNGSTDELEVAFTRAALQLSKHKKELKCIHDVLYDILQSKNSAAIVLFSKPSNNGYYRFIM